MLRTGVAEVPRQHVELRLRDPEESRKGWITAGKLAGFVVLEEDPHTVDRGKIEGIHIARTVVCGTTVYTAW